MKEKVNKRKNSFEIVDGKVKAKGYGNIADSVIASEYLSKGAKLLYVYLICKSGASESCYPSNSTIMKSIGIKSKITLNDCKAELENKGLLRIEGRKQKSGRLTSNNYFPTKMVLYKDES